MKKIILVLILFSKFLFAQNNALAFGGSDDYILIPDNSTLDITDAITIEVWVKLEEYPSFGRIVVKPYSDDYHAYRSNFFLGFESDNGMPRFGITTADSSHLDFNTGDSIDLDTWTHIAGTYSNSSGKMKIYVNGSLEGTRDFSGTIMTSDYDLTLGGRIYDVNKIAFEIKGQLDEVRIWNVERTETELNDYKDTELNGDETGLVAYYKMSDGSGSTLSDNSSNSNDGTLINDVTWVNETPLPVELVTFSANVINNTVNLNWQTATEMNNYGFEIERKEINEKLTNNNWEKIGFIEGHGNSNSPKQYSFTDKIEKFTNYTYRLKQIDIDGNFNYSNEIEVSFNSPIDFNLEQNYPNPFNPTTIIGFSIPEHSNVTLKIFNVLGKEIKTLVNEQKSPGIYKVKFDASDLPSGIYFYRLKSNNFLITKKLMLTK